MANSSAEFDALPDFRESRPSLEPRIVSLRTVAAEQQAVAGNPHLRASAFLRACGPFADRIAGVAPLSNVLEEICRAAACELRMTAILAVDSRGAGCDLVDSIPGWLCRYDQDEKGTALRDAAFRDVPQVAEPVVVANVTADRGRTILAPFARRLNMTACWLFPLRLRRAPVGTFVFGDFRPRAPRPEELAVIQTAVSLVQLAVITRSCSAK